MFLRYLRKLPLSVATKTIMAVGLSVALVWVMTVAYTVPAVEKLLAGGGNIHLFIRTILILGSLGTAFAIFLGWVISREIFLPLAEVSKAMEMASTGDLTSRAKVENNDELGRLAQRFNTMADNLSSLISDTGRVSAELAMSSDRLRDAAREASQSAESVALTISQVAQGAEEQARAVEEMTSRLEQVMNGVSVTASAVQQFAADVGKGATTAMQGSAVVKQAIQQMASIQTAASNSAEAVGRLQNLSEQIGEIAQSIQWVAEQTNLLALNAAIEAARAGEHGKGFAVVAEEVRKLAGQAGQAARDIASLLVRIREESAATVAAMQQGAREVESGITIVRDAEAAFMTITQLVQYLAGQFENLASTASNMADDSRSALGSTTALAAVVTQTAASAQEVSALAQEQSAGAQEVASAAEAIKHLAEDLHKHEQAFIL